MQNVFIVQNWKRNWKWETISVTTFNLDFVILVIGAENHTSICFVKTCSVTNFHVKIGIPNLVNFPPHFNTCKFGDHCSFLHDKSEAVMKIETTEKKIIVLKSKIEHWTSNIVLSANDILKNGIKELKSTISCNAKFFEYLSSMMNQSKKIKHKWKENHSSKRQN